MLTGIRPMARASLRRGDPRGVPLLARTETRMTDQLSIDQDHQDHGRAFVVPRGALDVNSSSQLRSALVETVEAGTDALVVAPPSAVCGELELPNRPSSVRRARGAARILARRNGCGPRTAENVALAVSEAVSNALIHGYGESTGRVQMVVEVSADEF